MMKIAFATERSDLPRLVSAAIRAANSQNVSDVKRCFDVLRHMKSLNLSVKDLSHSKVILPLESLRDHENPKIRMEANVLFNSWMKTLYSSGRNSSTCNKAIPLKLKKVGVVKVCSELKKKKEDQLSHGFAVKSKKETGFCVMKKNEDERSQVHESGEMKQIGDCKSFASRTIQKKKNSTEMLELFDMAKKSADVANAKGILAAKEEASICVDTLSLLMEFPIISTASETRQIMVKLERLTKHKDRKICNSALALLHHWRQNIRD
ncbi:Transcription factor IIS N-terminal [Arabidopsis suecica]|uniref:Transcription factor IIS N-terminal n=1 Tax=Arabidopsis suecica TaxID=45249 RepID=A0A8T2AL27_ARASU|nr:Transcription factor IIS N-terminal [Arabidopsis suecica]